MKVNKSSTRLYASPKGVITQFLFLPGTDRVMNIINRLKGLDEEEVIACMDEVMTGFGSRHRNLEETFLHHFNRIKNQYAEHLLQFNDVKKLLLGAFFTKEYSIMAAALFNPSIVTHPYQGQLKADKQRFIMSLRATGEGHISSVVFKTGIVDKAGNIILDNASEYFTRLEKNEKLLYNKDFIRKRTILLPGFKDELIDILPDTFTVPEVFNMISEENGFTPNHPMYPSVKLLEEIFDTNYELEKSAHLPINEKVFFPNAKAESMGIEDVRFVKFTDGDYSCYYGTYTAYDGKNIKTQLIETDDFDIFRFRALYGGAVSDKGMALFPEKVNGKYVMVSRQGGEKINIMFSDDLYTWNDYQLLLEPHYIWEFVQSGNCGSPIKTAQGWLLLIHGVGPMRTYVISAILLDLQDPSKIIGRLKAPLIAADESEREGYVPNVVYTCGFMQHGKLLIIPYAVSDSATGFVTIELDELINEMQSSIDQ